MPSFREQRVASLVHGILRRQSHARYAAAFHVVHFSIQSNHLHLLVEADDDALRSGVTGFVVSFARRLNAMLGRNGRVWGDRYHARDLATPRETRNALVYVFQNHKKHGHAPPNASSIDAWSSATHVDGWLEGAIRLVDSRILETQPFSDALFDTEPWPSPRTWLLNEGWRRALGPISLFEAPRTSRRPRAH